MGVRCDNPFPQDFMNTVRCVSLVGDTATLVEPRYLWVHVDLPCLSLCTFLDFFVRRLGALCLRPPQLSQLHQMASIC